MRPSVKSLYENLLFWPGMSDKLGLYVEKQRTRDPNEPWAVNIDPDVEAVPIETLIELWHVRFPEAPGPDEVIKAGKFYYEASRRLWRDKQLHKEEHAEGGTRFIVQSTENVCKS